MKTSHRLAILVIGFALLLPSRVPAAEEPNAETPEIVQEDAWVPVPFRIRNLTFPTVLTMGFMPRPTNPIGKGAWAVELNASVSNNFQMSAGIEDWLSGRGGPRRPVSPTDATAVLAALEEPQFLIDGELNVVDLTVHVGLTPHLSASLRMGYLGYSGGFMDSFIQGFHDLLGIGQAGREFIGKGDFQILFMNDGESLVLHDRPSSGGVTDPTLSLTYSFPKTTKGWSFSIEGAIKPPVADRDDWLSSGSWDVGVQASAQRIWGKNAVVLNLAVVAPGDFNIEGGFDPAALPSANLAYVRRLTPRTTAVVQALYSENIFRDEVDSDLSAYEFQMTAGVRFDALGGVIGVAVTENLFNFDNTPDFGFHVSYSRLIGGRKVRNAE